jgi:hypothetical protein
MQMTVSRRVASGLSLTGNYTWSRTLDSSSGSPQDSYNARGDYGLSTVHRAHLLNINYIYELPFFRRNRNAAIRNVLGGWEFAGVTTYQSGAPNSISVSSDVARIGASSSRASLIANPNLAAGDRTQNRWFNTEAALPPERMVQGVFGTGGRNVLIGPGFNQWDISAIKNFEIREHTRLQFRAESFNVVNHASFTGIDTTARFDSAGKPAQTCGAVAGAGPARVLEFGMKLLW